MYQHTRQHFQLNMGATAYTPWVKIADHSALGITAECGDVNDPVGVLTAEMSFDWEQIEREMSSNVASASSTAVKYDISSALSGNTVGTAWATGFDGVGAKAARTGVTNLWMYVRVKYTRTSGGAGDTLHLRIFGRP